MSTLKVKINDLTEYGDQQISLDAAPNVCPFCHHKIHPIFQCGIVKGTDVGRKAECVFQCPNYDCRRLFIGYYDFENPTGKHWIYALKAVSRGTVRYLPIDEIITKMSPAYEEIFNQASAAEQMGLNLICGVGYRKALEFLIKDYLMEKSDSAAAREKLQTKALGNCIKENITDDKVKKAAERATWLGNDETHYTRKWEGKDLSDLKTLIQLTIHWIITEKLTEGLEQDMPPPSKT